MRPNRFLSQESRQVRAIFARIKPGSELILGIQEICRQHFVTSGVVVSGIGSLGQSTFVYLRSDESAPLGAIYVEPQVVNGPLELLGVQGTIGLTQEENISVHLHATMMTADMTVCGGHLMEAGNSVLATAEVMIFATPEFSLIKKMDPETGFELFNPVPQN